MKKITLWYRYNPTTRKMEYNHYSDNWTLEITPQPKTEDQLQSWEKARWAKEFAFMEGSTIKHMDEI